MADIIKPLEEAWNTVVSAIRESDNVRPFWSEGDLLHAIATRYELNLTQHGIVDMNVHVAPSLLPSVFDGELRKNLEGYLSPRNKRRIIPDLVVQKVGDISERFELCAELKLRLGNHPYWSTWIRGKKGVEEDLKSLPQLKLSGICSDIIMLVAYDPDPPIRKEAIELNSLLGGYEQGVRILRYIRYTLTLLRHFVEGNYQDVKIG